MQFAAAWCLLAALTAHAAKTQPSLKALVQDRVKPKESEATFEAGGGSVSIASLVVDKNASSQNSSDVEPVELVPPTAVPVGPGPEFAPAAAPAAAPIAAPAPAPAAASPPTGSALSWLPWFLSPSKIWDYIFGTPKHTPATLAQIKDLDEAVFAPAPVRKTKKDSTFAPAPPLNSLNSSFLQQPSESATHKVTKVEERDFSWLSWLWPFQSEEKPDQKESVLEELRVGALAGGVTMK